MPDSLIAFLQIVDFCIYAVGLGTLLAMSCSAFPEANKFPTR